MSCLDNLQQTHFPFEQIPPSHPQKLRVFNLTRRIKIPPLSLKTDPLFMAYHHPIQSTSSALHFLNSPFGDTTFTKVFVGGLAWETQSETLRRHFEQYGEILEAVVISDRSTGRSKGYGFVTFRDPESASRACTDPSPIVDGRRANCNLASLGRPRPATPFDLPSSNTTMLSDFFGIGAQLRPPGPYFGTVPIPLRAYAGSSAFNQTVPYGYHQGIPYSPYVFTAYGPECVYPQNVYNPYMGQQYVQVYSVPGTTNTALYPYGQLGQPVPAGHCYTTAAAQGYTVPGHHFVQFGGPNVNGVTASSRPAIQTPFPSGLVAPVPAPHFIIPAQSPLFTPGSSSDQTVG